MSIALELDRGHVEQKRWQAKVAALCAWAGHTRTRSKPDNLTVAVVTPTPTRRDELMEWTRRELQERHLTDYAAIFLFTDADPTTLPPTSFFFDRHWRELPAPDPVSILDPLTGEVAVFHAGADPQVVRFFKTRMDAWGRDAPRPGNPAWSPAGRPAAAPSTVKGACRVAAQWAAATLDCGASMRPVGQGCGQAGACPGQTAGPGPVRMRGTSKRRTELLRFLSDQQ